MLDYLNELEKKLGRYLAMQDCPATWAEIYKDGGMDQIGEYSKRLESEGVDEKSYEHKVNERYWVGAGHAAESEEDRKTTTIEQLIARRPHDSKHHYAPSASHGHRCQ